MRGSVEITAGRNKAPFFPRSTEPSPVPRGPLEPVACLKTSPHPPYHPVKHATKAMNGAAPFGLP
eukprot:8879543-Lingulodinium_polyedra.AAC.1